MLLLQNVCDERYPLIKINQGFGTMCECWLGTALFDGNEWKRWYFVPRKWAIYNKDYNLRRNNERRSYPARLAYFYNKDYNLRRNEERRFRTSYSAKLPYYSHHNKTSLNNFPGSLVNVIELAKDQVLTNDKANVYTIPLSISNHQLSAEVSASASLNDEKIIGKIKFYESNWLDFIN